MQNSVLESRLKEIKHEEFIGLEYVIEVNNGITFESVFYCVLCDRMRSMEINIVIAHLTAFDHRLKYLEKHFPTAFKEMSVLKSDKRKCKIVLEKLCEAIEERYGRQSVLVVENKEFGKNRMKFTEQALHTTHFDEYMGCTFTELIRNEADKGENLTSSLLDSKYGNLDRHSLISSGSKFKTKMQNSVLESRLKEIKHEEFIGLEYVIEVNNGITFESVFYCVLCDRMRSMEINIVIAHLTAFDHRLKYLEKHFPTAFKEMSVLKSDKRKCKIVLEKLCEAIEERYGRQSVLVVENKEFGKNRMKFTEQALHTTHFDEYMGCTFTELIRNEADKGENLTSSLLDSKYGNLDRHSLISSGSKFKTPEDVTVRSRNFCRYSSSTPSTSNYTPFTNRYQVAPKFERFNSYSERRQNQMYKMETFRPTDYVEKTRHERKRVTSEFTSDERKNSSREWSSEEESQPRASRSNQLSERSHRRLSPKISRSYKELRSCRRSQSPEPYRATPKISTTASQSPKKQSRLSPRMSYSSERFEYDPDYYGYRRKRKSTSALASLPTLSDNQPFNASSTFSIPKEASRSCSNAMQSTIPFNLYESSADVCSSSQSSDNKENKRDEIAKRISSAYLENYHEHPTESQLENYVLEYERIESEEKKNSADSDKVGSRTVVEQHGSVKEINEIRSVSHVDVICIEDNDELDEHINEVSNNVPSMSLSPISPSGSVGSLIPQSLRQEIYSTCPTSSSSNSESYPIELTTLSYKELNNLVRHFESLSEKMKKDVQKLLRKLKEEKSKIVEQLMSEHDSSIVWLWDCQGVEK